MNLAPYSKHNRQSFNSKEVKKIDGNLLNILINSERMKHCVESQLILKISFHPKSQWVQRINQKRTLKRSWWSLVHSTDVACYFVYIFLLAQINIWIWALFWKPFENAHFAKTFDLWRSHTLLHGRNKQKKKQSIFETINWKDCEW